MAQTDLDSFSKICIQCGACLEDCALLSNLGQMPGDLAQSLAEGRIDGETLAAVQRCDLCQRCSQVCPVGLNPSLLFQTARELLIASGHIDPEEYDVMLVDRDWNFFSIYRDTYGIDYSDLTQEQAEHFDRLFFPGCTLAAYAPELTRAAYTWLQGQGLRTGFTDLCCAKPLDSIGLVTSAERYLDRLRDLLSRSGAKQIITACSNCEAHLKQHIPEIEIHSIYSLLRQEGIHLSGSETITFHDSCPDRFNPRNPADARALFNGFPQVEMSSHGENAICCGSGGIVSTIDPDLSISRAQRRLNEFSSSGANLCLTTCMACSYRLARAGNPGSVRHCLELIFDIAVDYDQVEANAHAMWEGDMGQINIARVTTQTSTPESEKHDC